MTNPRPSAEEVAAKQREIAQRYDWAQRQKSRKPRTRPNIRTLRLAELNRILRDRYGKSLPDRLDDHGRALINALVGYLSDAPDGLFSVQLWARHWGLASVPVTKPRRWTADTLGKAIGLTDKERTALRIRTIGAVDCPSKSAKLAERRRPDSEHASGARRGGPIAYAVYRT